MPPAAPPGAGSRTRRPRAPCPPSRRRVWRIGSWSLFPPGSGWVERDTHYLARGTAVDGYRARSTHPTTPPSHPEQLAVACLDLLAHALDAGGVLAHGLDLAQRLAAGLLLDQRVHRAHAA